MNNYELALVLSAKLDDAQRSEALDKVQGYIARFGGTITNFDVWGKRRLAYEIQKMKEGYYYFIQFAAPAECPAQLEANVRIMEPVIRYLIVSQDEEEAKKAALRKADNEAKAQAAAEEAAAAAQAAAEAPAEEAPAEEAPAQEAPAEEAPAEEAPAETAEETVNE